MLKLYVWENVLCDYTCGMIVALAHDKDEARRLVIEKHGPYGIGDDIAKEPLEVTKPDAFWAWGGG